MASISLEATITLVLGIPSLIVAVLTWWETRYSRRNAILANYDNEDIFRILMSQNDASRREVLPASHSQPPEERPDAYQIALDSDRLSGTSHLDSDWHFQNSRLHHSFASPLIPNYDKQDLQPDTDRKFSEPFNCPEPPVTEPAPIHISSFT